MTFVHQVPPKPNLNPGWLKDAAKEAAKTTTDKKSPLKKKAAPTTPASAAKVEIISLNSHTKRLSQIFYYKKNKWSQKDDY